MDRVYGADRQLQEAKRQEYLRALELYRSRLGADDQVMLVRAPGRINLMGRHTDHRGSRTNMIAISEEILMVVSARQDDQVHLYSTAEHLVCAHCVLHLSGSRPTGLGRLAHYRPQSEDPGYGQ